MNLRLCLSIVFAGALAAASAAAPPQLIDLDTSGPRPTAMLTIENAKPVPVIFDTGAGGSVLSTSLGEEHKLPNLGEARISSPGAKQALTVFRSKLPLARLGSADVSGANVVVGELGVPLPGIAGVMSPNLFKGKLVRFELARNRVVVQPKWSETLPDARSFPYHGAHPLPSITLELGRRIYQAHLDTGSGRGLAFPLELASELPLQGAMTPAKTVFMAGGERKAFTARISGTVRAGPITLENPEITLIERFQYVNLGFSILKNWTIVLDPEGQRSWVLEPEAR
jgi:hypothetical protein